MSIKREELKVGETYVSGKYKSVVKFVGEKYLIADFDHYGKEDWREGVVEVEWFLGEYSLPPKKRELIELGYYYRSSGVVCLLDKQGRAPLFSSLEMSATVCLNSLKRPVKGMKNIFIDAETFEIIEKE